MTLEIRLFFLGDFGAKCGKLVVGGVVSDVYQVAIELVKGALNACCIGEVVLFEKGAEVV